MDITTLLSSGLLTSTGGILISAIVIYFLGKEAISIMQIKLQEVEDKLITFTQSIEKKVDSIILDIKESNKMGVQNSTDIAVLKSEIESLKARKK